METKEQTIRKILKEAEDQIKSEVDLSNIDSGTKFETYVTLVIEDIANKYGIKVEQTGAQSFPDIVIGDTYGIEVKYTKSEKWESIGNSIFEGTLRKEVKDQTFIFFGRKVGKKIQVKWRPYVECLAEIKVTHSPRFYLNMELDEGDSILQKIGVSYEKFKSIPPLEKSKTLKEYVKSTLDEGETLWWLDDEEGISPKIKEYRKLQPHQKKNIMLEGMALFPELFSNSSTKYLNLSMYLLQEYQIVSSSLRDAYTAGGQTNVIVNGKPYTVPKIYDKLYKNAKEILKLIESYDKDKLKQLWEEQSKKRILCLDDRLDVIYKYLIDLYAYGLPKEITASDIFESGLEF